MPRFLASKLDRMTVTGNTHDGAHIDRMVLQEAGIHPYEQLHVHNITARREFLTYAIPDDTPGGLALPASIVGDVCVITVYRDTALYEGSLVLKFDDPTNLIYDREVYTGKAVA